MDTEEKIVDFSALEVELQAAIQRDIKYWRENDAKLRAVEQRVATYDEFRNIVKAAHLKPLEKKEIQNNICDNRNKVWNTISSKNNMDSYTPTEQFTMKKEETGVIPRTGIEFAKQWNKLHPSNRFQYLKDIGLHSMKQLFMTEIPVDVFGTILLSVSQTLPADAPGIAFCINLLLSLTQINKFNLNLQFMSSAETSECRKLMDRLYDCFLQYQEQLREDGITEEMLTDLKNKYGIN